MKIFYFFDILLIISRIDMKQTAKNLLRPMHSFPFTFFLTLAQFFIIFFFAYFITLLTRFVEYFNNGGPEKGLLVV